MLLSNQLSFGILFLSLILIRIDSLFYIKKKKDNKTSAILVRNISAAKAHTKIKTKKRGFVYLSTAPLNVRCQDQDVRHFEPTDFLFRRLTVFVNGNLQILLLKGNDVFSGGSDGRVGGS